jgi:hypothetical protein
MGDELPCGDRIAQGSYLKKLTVMVFLKDWVYGASRFNKLV